MRIASTNSSSRRRNDGLSLLGSTSVWGKAFPDSSTSGGTGSTGGGAAGRGSGSDSVTSRDSLLATAEDEIAIVGEDWGKLATGAGSLAGGVPRGAAAEQLKQSPSIQDMALRMRRF